MMRISESGHSVLEPRTRGAEQTLASYIVGQTLVVDGGLTLA